MSQKNKINPGTKDQHLELVAKMAREFNPKLCDKLSLTLVLSQSSDAFSKGMSTCIEYLRRRFVDLSTFPIIPQGLELDTYELFGKCFEWDPERIKLLQCKSQFSEGYLPGGNIFYELKAEFPHYAFLNKSLLDHLLEFPELIPQDWKGKIIIFWGTQFYHANGSCVFGLYWSEKKSKWCSDYILLKQRLGIDHYAIGFYKF